MGPPRFRTGSRHGRGGRLRARLGGWLRRCAVAALPALCLASATARAGEDPRFTVIPVDTRHEPLSLFWRDPAGQPWRSFAALDASLAARGKHLRFAMNAGMYQPDLSPVGLLVVDGRQQSPLNLAEGFGNFFLKPNGVFLVTAQGPRVVESSEYPALASGVRLATQSGPMLLRHGVLHPAFRAGSVSRLIRNGVGVCGGRAVFVISEQPVNFHEFASFFRDRLHCQDALYLDGTVSSLHSTALKRSDAKTDLGPMLGIVD